MRNLTISIVSLDIGLDDVMDKRLFNMLDSIIPHLDTSLSFCKFRILAQDFSYRNICKLHEYENEFRGNLSVRYTSRIRDGFPLVKVMSMSYADTPYVMAYDDDFVFSGNILNWVDAIHKSMFILDRADFIFHCDIAVYKDKGNMIRFPHRMPNYFSRGRIYKTNRFTDERYASAINDWTTAVTVEDIFAPMSFLKNGFLTCILHASDGPSHGSYPQREISIFKKVDGTSFGISTPHRLLLYYMLCKPLDEYKEIYLRVIDENIDVLQSIANEYGIKIDREDFSVYDGGPFNIDKPRARIVHEIYEKYRGRPDWLRLAMNDLYKKIRKPEYLESVS